MDGWLNNITQLIILLLPILSAYLLASFFLGEGSNLIDKINFSFFTLCCLVVFMTEILSLLKSIGGNGYLIASTVIFATCLACRPKNKDYLGADYKQLCVYRNHLWSYVKGERIIVVFLCVLFVSIVWRIFLVIHVPPNNWDSMSYHLSRVAYWMQNHSLEQFDTHYWAQRIHPFNAEIMLLWTMVASRTDILCGFVQLICYALSGTLIYACVRRYLKANTLTAISIVLLWYSLPEVILESTSTQNDLVVSYFIMFSLTYFLTGALTEGQWNIKQIIMSAGALAFAVGTKTTALFYAIPFALLICVLLLRKHISVKILMVWSVAVLAFLIFIGAYNYVQNYMNYQHVLGGPEDVIDTYKAQNVSVKTVCSNLFRYEYNLLVNQTGLHFWTGQRFCEYYNLLTGKIGEALFQVLQIPVNIPGAVIGRPFSFYDCQSKFQLSQENAFFGPVGAIITIMAVTIALMSIIKCLVRPMRFNLRYGLFAFLLLGYLLSLSCAMKWQPWMGRYLIGAVIVGMPLIAPLFENPAPFFKIISKSLLIYCSLLLIPATFMNVSKSLTDLNKDKYNLRFIVRPQMVEIFKKLDKLVPLDLPHQKIGVLFKGSQWDYPLFGEKLQRVIIPVNYGKLKNETFDYLIISERELEKNPSLKNMINRHYSLLEKLVDRKNQEWKMVNESDWILFKFRK